MNLYQEISKIFGIYTTKKNFDATVKSLDVAGGITSRIMLNLIVLLIKYVDEKRPSSSV